jgi:hypothetical protein
MKYAVEIASCGMIYLMIFIKIGTGIEKIIRFFFRNLRGCNIGITDGKDLRSAPLKLTQVA